MNDLEFFVIAGLICALLAGVRIGQLCEARSWRSKAGDPRYRTESGGKLYNVLPAALYDDLLRQAQAQAPNCCRTWKELHEHTGSLLRAQHTRIGELLAANNAEADTRQAAEAERDDLRKALDEAFTFITQPLRMDSGAARCDGIPTATYDSRPYNSLVARLMKVLRP